MESNNTPETWGSEVPVENGEEIETCIVMFQEDIDMLPEDTAFEVMVQAVDSVEYLEDGTRQIVRNTENGESSEEVSNELSDSSKSVIQEIVKAVVSVQHSEREANQNSDDGESMDVSETVSNESNCGESTSTVVDNNENSNNSKEAVTKFNLEYLQGFPMADKTTCIYCGKKMSNSGNMHRHMRVVHNVELNKNSSNIRCMQCDTGFMHVAELRAHLQDKHEYNMAVEELTFPNMNAFSKWKCQMERDTLTNFTRRHGSRKAQDGLTHFYTCHRSGKFVPKPKERKRLARFSGSCKTGFACTATMKCVDGPNGVKVTFCPHHYGHGNIPVVIVTEEDQKIIDETSSRGFTLDNIKQDIQKQPVDHFQLDLVRKKDMRCITRAYRSEEFKKFDLQGPDNIERWVSYCASMEHPPVLLYQKDEYGTEDEGRSELILIIMSEFQRYFLCNSSKQVVCLDTHSRLKGGRYYVLALLIIDETEFAIPVAFCITTKTPKHVVSTFFGTLKEHVGPLTAKYFISDNERFYHETWNSIMDSDSKWLWNSWHVQNRLRCHLKVLKENPTRKAHAHKTIKTLVECQNEIMFSCLYEDFIDNLRKGLESKSSVDLIQQRFGNHAEMWAYCFRKDISYVAATNLAMMHETIRFCVERGRHKPMEKFIFVLMKLVREKILFRLSKMVDEDSFENIQSGINEYHKRGLEIPPEYVTLLTKNHWLVLTDTEDEYFYVTLDYEFCPDECLLKCVDCDICVHTYSCTCNANLFGADLCEHIHAVVWNFVTDHLPQHDEEVEEDVCADADSFNENEPFDSGELLECVLQKTHELYKKVRMNKFEVNTKTLLDLKRRLCDCIDICDGKEIEVPTTSDAQPSRSEPNASASAVPTLSSNTAPQPVPVGQQIIIMNPYIGYNGFSPIAFNGQISTARKIQVLAPAPQGEKKSS